MPINNISKKKRFFSPKFYRHLPETNIIGNNSDQTHIYYSLQIYNDTTDYDSEGNPISTVLAVPADYSQNRVQDFINRPSEYDATVTYFHIDSNSFPSQIVYPKVGKNFQTPLVSPSGTYTIGGVESIYEIKLELTWQIISTPFPLTFTDEITVPIYWTPLDNRVDTPSFPITKENITNEYFWNYNYDYFLDLVNTTIGYAMDRISVGNSVTYDGFNPYFVFDGTNNLIKFTAPFSFETDIQGNNVNLSVSTPTWKIFVNEPLYQLIQGMQSLYETKYQLLVIPSPDASNIVPQNSSLSATPSTNYIQTTTEFTSSFLWNPVVSIVFVTPHVDVVNELNGQPFISGINPNPPVNNASLLNILFEYMIGRRADPVINSYVKAEYRLTQMLGIQPISEIQVQTYWKDEFGMLHRFFIEQGSGMNMKILFRKR
jgi:hypothetical protein